MEGAAVAPRAPNVLPPHQNNCISKAFSCTEDDQSNALESSRNRFPKEDRDLDIRHEGLTLRNPSSSIPNEGNSDAMGQLPNILWEIEGKDWAKQN